VILLLAVSIGIAADHELERTIVGVNAFGRAVAGCGDINDDGYDDMLVSDPTALVSPNSGVGTVDVISGKDGTSLKHLEGDETWGFFGSDLAAAGDVNNDGVPDILIGARMNGLDHGAVRVYSGKDWTKLHDIDGSGAGVQFGFSVSGAGDVNDDEYDDFIVGEPRNETGSRVPGAAHVISGKDGTKLYTYEGDYDEDDFGYDVTGGYDFNGDGRPDFAVGAPIYDGGSSNDWAKGLVRLYSGKDGKEIRSISESRGYMTGWALAGIPDLNADGCDDLVAGAPGAENDGKAFVYSGKDGKTLFTLEPDDDGLNSKFGDEVGNAGDLDGDGWADIIVGARLDGKNGRDAGAVYVFSGKSGDLLYEHRGTVEEVEFGFAVAGVGDVNQDGRADYAIGGYGQSKVFVYGSRGPGGKITIDEGAAYATERDVTLGITYADTSSTVTGMRIRNAGDAWGGWITPAATKSWTLASGDGVKTVEAEFKNALDDVSPTVEAKIFLDETAPTGSIVIDAGADFTATDLVPIALTFADPQSGIDMMRIRDGGGEWEDWTEPLAGINRTLPGDDGSKTIEVQYRDQAGNLSDVLADAITLDRTGPTGALRIAGGADFTASDRVALSIPATDAHSGVADVRIRNGGGLWAGWNPWVDPVTITLPGDDGEKTIEVQFRDFLENESEIYTDTIVLDTIAPTIQSLSANGNRPYIVPAEPIEVGIQSFDGVGGSDVAEFRIDFGAGSSDWAALGSGFDEVEVAHPGLYGTRTATVVIRDGVGNLSDARAVGIYLIEENLLEAPGGGKFTGTMPTAGDVDTVKLSMVEGDLLSATVNAKSSEKKKSLLLAIDLVRPDGTRILVDRYPADAKKPGIKAYPVTETGEYLLIVRRDPSSESSRGSFKLAVKVKQSKTNKKSKGEATGETLTFDAVDGATLKATIQGEGLAATGMTLTGPDGAVAFTTKEKNGKVTILPVVLDAGTGAYTIRLPAAMTVSFKWSLKLPKKTKGEIQG
jgi:hypothetical protein